MELIYHSLIAALSVAAAAALFLGGVIGAVAVGLLKDEASAWLPTLTSSIVSLAVKRMKQEERERYAEEWSSHILQYPGRISQLYQALKCLCAARELSIRVSWLSPHSVFITSQIFFGAGIISGIVTAPESPLALRGLVGITVTQAAFILATYFEYKIATIGWRSAWETVKGVVRLR
ncbi:hypothetical protein E8E01_23350 [Methylorubrum populi]|uniref:hypothetical protein n=1 Tax=Methylorubrum populi TaxID=223967 RepID=UPI00114E8E11|nr:hypothetical protein [Methylorubrum populi]QDI83138.1 hypothetical protein E8E01_23350 [Methylorubrum populi]